METLILSDDRSTDNPAAETNGHATTERSDYDIARAAMRDTSPKRANYRLTHMPVLESIMRNGRQDLNEIESLQFLTMPEMNGVQDPRVDEKISGTKILVHGIRSQINEQHWVPDGPEAAAAIDSIYRSAYERAQKTLTSRQNSEGSDA